MYLLFRLEHRLFEKTFQNVELGFWKNKISQEALTVPVGSRLTLPFRGYLTCFAATLPVRGLLYQFRGLLYLFHGYFARFAATLPVSRLTLPVRGLLYQFRGYFTCFAAT